MKIFYAKALIIITLLFTASITSNAQQWMVGSTLNDTLKYLKILPLSIDSATSCYDTGVPDAHFKWETCPDPGVDYGFVVQEITSSDTIEITPSGVMAVGDTVWCTEEPLWVIIDRKVYFHEPDGYILLRFFAVGEVTMPDVIVPCLPADSLWISDLLICNELYSTFFNCTTVSNPLSIEDITLDDFHISYPSTGNGYQLSIGSSEGIACILIYDMQGKIVANSAALEH